MNLLRDATKYYNTLGFSTVIRITSIRNTIIGDATLADKVTGPVKTMKNHQSDYPS